MKMPWQRTTWENAIKANVALSFAVGILSIMALISLTMVISAYDRERIVLTPPYVDKTMSIGWDAANEDYLKSIGLYLATLIGNLSSANAKFVADSLSHMISPGEYSEVRKTILATAETRSFREAAASTKFTPSGVFYEAETTKVFVTGNMDILNAGMSNQSQPTVYEMKISIVNGRPSISNLLSYQDNTPHTMKWIEEHPINSSATTEGGQ